MQSRKQEFWRKNGDKGIRRETIAIILAREDEGPNYDRSCGDEKEKITNGINKVAVRELGDRLSEDVQGRRCRCPAPRRCVRVLAGTSFREMGSAEGEVGVEGERCGECPTRGPLGAGRTSTCRDPGADTPKGRKCRRSSYLCCHYGDGQDHSGKMGGSGDPVQASPPPVSPPRRGLCPPLDGRARTSLYPSRLSAYWYRLSTGHCTT